MPTRIYRNDSAQSYVIPGLGEVHAGQRVSISGEFPPPINLINYPGLVDVLAEEEAGKGRDYEKHPEVVTNTLVNPDGSASDSAIKKEINPSEEKQNG